VLPLVFAALIAGATNADIRGSWSPWRWPVLVWLGDTSYAFYLVHALAITNAIQLFERIDPDRRRWFGVQPLLGAGGLVPLGTLAAALLGAALLYYCVERPMNRVLSRRRPRPVPPSGAPITGPESAGPRAHAVGVATAEPG
jgi:peptidoglycan/LPS O-acetylase OafA/YrhL